MEWGEKGSEVTEKSLQTFIKANSKIEPVIKFGTDKKIALLEFDQEKGMFICLSKTHYTATRLSP